MPHEREFQVLGRTLTGLQWGNPAGAPTFALHGWLDNANTFNRLAPALPELNLLALDFGAWARSCRVRPGWSKCPISQPAADAASR